MAPGEETLLHSNKFLKNGKPQSTLLFKVPDPVKIQSALPFFEKPVIPYNSHFFPSTYQGRPDILRTYMLYWKQTNVITSHM